MPDAAILIDPGHFIVTANSRAADIFGTTVESMTGAPLDILIPEHAAGGRQPSADKSPGCWRTASRHSSVQMRHFTKAKPIPAAPMG
ncbi:hypothetical protein [Marinobacter sp. F4218]|uniref:hypothetical protein n=1 Tax=Marinobacter TaxID=2742 RepID=UPI003A5CE4C3